MSGFEGIHPRRWLRASVIALGAVLALGIAFGAGFWLGRSSPIRYYPLRQFERTAPRHGHGATGIIQEIAGQRIIIKTRDGILQPIVVNTDTRFDRNFQRISLNDLKVNDQVVVLGSPNSEDEIIARLVGLIEPSVAPRGFPMVPNR